MSFRCALALACFATVTSPGLSHAVRTPEPRCTEGTWTINGGPVTIGPFEIHTIALTAGVPSVTPFCRAQHWALQRTGELRVLFACRDADGGPRPRFPLRLRALLSDGCTHMEGAFAIRRMNALARFTATKTGGACTSNDDCTAEAFCRHPLGQCTAEGRCAVRPWSCFGVFKPSCGCDGRNHFACEAAQAGISIASIEPCTTACGGVTGAECPGGEFCELPTGTCGSADLEGRCVPIGDACPELYSPVCGCDGVTYANDCFRQTAGAQKAHDGACEDVCGGIAGIPCPPGQVCDLPSFGCGSADLQGQCRPIGYCTQQYDPVCGCDGKTYGNDCERRNAGVQLSHPGVCDCVPVCCTLGARPYDYNGDGCPDSCTADACAGAGCPSWCQTACDCYAKFGTSFCGECPLACPNCGEHWECKENFCAEACGVIPVDTIGCALDATR